jgi:hypothetical protein
MVPDNDRDKVFANHELMLHRLDEHSALLRSIEAHARITNGRVSQLELWQARMDGARQAFSWVPTLSVGVAVGLAGALVSHLF